MDLTKRVSENEIMDNLINLRQLVIEVTDACNLRCSYCAFRELYQDPGLRNSGNLAFEQIKPLLDYLIGLWNNQEANRVTDIGFYGGEPLLNIRLIRQVIAYLESNSADKLFTYSMTTNGMLIDRYMDFLVEKGFDLNISLDGDKEGQCYRLKPDGTNSFEDVYKNINLLRDKYPDYFEKKVSFHSIIHNRNTVRGVVDFFVRNYEKVPSLAEISTDGIREEKKEMFLSMHQDISKSIKRDRNSDELTKILGDEHPDKMTLYQYLKAYSGNIFDSYNSLIAGKSSSLAPTGTCYPFQMKLFVTVKGEILQCEQISREWIYGFVSSDGLSLDLTEIANKYNSLLDAVQLRCETCALSASCPVCMFYMENISSRPRCKDHRAKKQFDRYQSSCLSILDKSPELYRILIRESYSG